jgi:hypothetical protein
VYSYLSSLVWKENHPVPTYHPNDLLRYFDRLWEERQDYCRRDIGAAALRGILVDGFTSGALAVRLDVAASLGELRTWALWQQAGATVYVMNPDLVEGLQAAHDGFLDVPVAVFDRLPHPNPLFVFPDPPLIPLANGDQGYVLGIYIGGLQTADGLPDGATGTATRTDDPARNALNMTLVCKVADVPDTTDLSTIRFASPGVRTVAQAIEASARRYWVGVRPQLFTDTSREERVTAHVTAAASLAASCLAYVGAVNADVVRSPGVPRGRKAPGNPTGRANPPQWLQTGYVFGPQIGAARDHATGGGTGEGRQVRPHIRRLHPHTYWTGPGRTIPVIHILSPIAVNGGVSGVPTLHTVYTPDA